LLEPVLVIALELPFILLLVLWTRSQTFAKATAAYLGSALLVISAATVRNALVAKEFVLISTNTALIFHRQQRAGQRHGGQRAPGWPRQIRLLFRLSHGRSGTRAQAGQAHDPAQNLAYFRRQAWDYAQHTPPFEPSAC
jgi:hypothetical protein